MNHSIVRLVMQVPLLVPLFVLLFVSTAHSASSIPEFHKLDGNIYRGGRPGTPGITYLDGLGITTDIDLENNTSAVSAERSDAGQAGINFVSIPMSASAIPQDPDVNNALARIINAGGAPIFIHCMHGQDRTGLIIGLYRVEHDKWTPADAYREMLQDGFHPSLKALDHYFKMRTGYAP